MVLLLLWALSLSLFFDAIAALYFILMTSENIFERRTSWGGHCVDRQLLVLRKMIGRRNVKQGNRHTLWVMVIMVENYLWFDFSYFDNLKLKLNTKANFMFLTCHIWLFHRWVTPWTNYFCFTIFVREKWNVNRRLTTTLTRNEWMSRRVLYFSFSEQSWTFSLPHHSLSFESWVLSGMSEQPRCMMKQGIKKLMGGWCFFWFNFFLIDFPPHPTVDVPISKLQQIRVKMSKNPAMSRTRKNNDREETSFGERELN